MRSLCGPAPCAGYPAKPRKKGADHVPHREKTLYHPGAAIGAVFLFFVVVMMLTQLRDGEDYARQAAQGISITQQTSAARGEIVDATGKAFTGNTTICNITIDSNYFTEQELNPLLLTLTALCRDYGCEWRDELPISTEMPYTFTGEEAALRALRSKLQLSEAATPEDALYWLRELYNLNDYTDTDVLDRLRSRNKIEDLSDAEALDWLRNFRKTPDATDEELLSSLRTHVPYVPLHPGGAAAAGGDPLYHDAIGIFQLQSLYLCHRYQRCAAGCR